jgi:hypothetical protein
MRYQDLRRVPNQRQDPSRTILVKCDNPGLCQIRFFDTINADEKCPARFRLRNAETMKQKGSGTEKKKAGFHIQSWD